jgi:hypothetical protein
VPSFIRKTAGGTSVSGGALAPRNKRGNTAQTDAYWRGSGFSATGGAVTFYNAGGIDYQVHTFTSAGVFTITDSKTVDILIVGGGGGKSGGAEGAGGGGAGEMEEATAYLIPSGEYLISVGAGGNGVLSPGAPSTFGSLFTAVGGGGGAQCCAYGGNGQAGGSGGGGGSPGSGGSSGGGSTKVSGTGSISYGNGGGSGFHQPGQYHYGGGGGGAGGAGGSSDGGAGRNNSWQTGSAIQYATGGNGNGNSVTGGRDPVPNRGDGGSGGGGARTQGTDGIVIVRIKMS